MKRLLIVSSLLVAGIGCSNAETEVGAASTTDALPENAENVFVDGEYTMAEAQDMQLTLNALAEKSNEAAAQSSDTTEMENLQALAKNASDFAARIEHEIVVALSNGDDAVIVGAHLDDMKVEYDQFLAQSETNVQTMSEAARGFMAVEIATARDSRRPDAGVGNGRRPGGNQGGNRPGGGNGGNRPGGDRPGGGNGGDRPGGGHGGDRPGGGNGGDRPGGGNGGDRPGGGNGGDRPGGGNGGERPGGGNGGGWPGGGNGGGNGGGWPGGGNGGGHGGGWPTPKPRPIPFPIPFPVPQPSYTWVAQCSFNLEDRYGSIYRKFQANGQSRDRFQAIGNARKNALSQCRPFERNGAYQCVEVRCDSYRK